MRGLKSVARVIYLTDDTVAPYTGAWIEINEIRTVKPNILSHPTRVRGLKFIRLGRRKNGKYVAPYTGAWIEIASFKSFAKSLFVAPYTGAWIEIWLPKRQTCRS